MSGEERDALISDGCGRPLKSNRLLLLLMLLLLASTHHTSSSPHFFTQLARRAAIDHPHPVEPVAPAKKVK